MSEASCSEDFCCYRLGCVQLGPTWSVCPMWETTFGLVSVRARENSALMNYLATWLLCYWWCSVKCDRPAETWLPVTMWCIAMNSAIFENCQCDFCHVGWLYLVLLLLPMWVRAVLGVVAGCGVLLLLPMRKLAVVGWLPCCCCCQCGLWQSYSVKGWLWWSDCTAGQHEGWLFWCSYWRDFAAV